MWYNCGFLSFDLQATRTEGSIQSGRLLSECSILALPPKSLLFLQLDWVLAQAILNSYLFSPYSSSNAVYLAICTSSPHTDGDCLPPQMEAASVFAKCPKALSVTTCLHTWPELVLNSHQ